MEITKIMTQISNFTDATFVFTSKPCIDPNLEGEGGTFTPCWFSLNNSKMVKATTLALCSIQ